MKKFKGTKGDWHLDSEEARKGEYEAYELDINFNEYRFHCATVYCDAEIPTEEELANAKLITAAPDLLEALMSIENDNNTIPKNIWDMRNEAIKKAIG